MTTRIAQGITGFVVSSSEDDRVAQGISAFVVTSQDDIRIAQAMMKFVVRPYPIQRVAMLYPPINTTQAQAPFVRVNRS